VDLPPRRAAAHSPGLAARSSHNLHVWRGGDYLGLGPGAHGRITLAEGRIATVAHRRIGDYVQGVAARDPWAERELRMVARDFSSLPVTARLLVEHLQAPMAALAAA
jgi:coproporphyrinogen III oxidase-like Fe-S oxidoreductase